MSDVFKWDADGQNIKMRGATGKADGKHVSSLFKLLFSDMRFNYLACIFSVVRRSRNSISFQKPIWGTLAYAHVANVFRCDTQMVPHRC